MDNCVTNAPKRGSLRSGNKKMFLLSNFKRNSNGKYFYESGSGAVQFCNAFSCTIVMAKWY